MGFCLGLFVSFLPIPPFQTLSALLLAYICRSNKVASLIGLHIHLLFFPVVPIVFLLEYKIGYRLLDWRLHPNVDTAEITIAYLLQKGWPVLKAMLIGALVLGIPSCLLTYPLVWRAAIRWQEARRNRPPPPTDDDLEAI